MRVQDEKLQRIAEFPARGRAAFRRKQFRLAFGGNLHESLRGLLPDEKVKV